MIVAVVHWRDAARYDDSTWKAADDDYALIPMTTVGALADDYIVVAQDFSSARPYTPYRGVMIVPKVNVVEILRIDTETFR